MSNEIVKILAEADKAEGYVFRNRCVFLDDGGSGEVLDPAKVVALSDGSLFLKADWDRMQPVRTANGNIGLWHTEHMEKSCPVTGATKVLVLFGKDTIQSWMYLHSLQLVQPVGEDMILEDFTAPCNVSPQ